jgi:hypothetical protein
MNSKFVGCERIINYPKIVIKDLKAKNNCNLVIVNKSRKPINVVTIDGCVIKVGERCDFLVLHGNDSRFTEEIYVELKGSNVKKAISQLETTIEQVSYEKYTIIKRCFIIVRSHCPRTTGELQVTQIIFKKKYNSSLIV